MIDTSLMHHLLKAVPSGATLILVGDVNQLPSVGAGNVLKVDPVRKVRWSSSKRFSASCKQRDHPQRPPDQHRACPELTQEREGLGDFYFIEQEDQEEVLRIIMELVCQRIPKRFNLDPLEGIQCWPRCTKDRGHREPECETPGSVESLRPGDPPRGQNFRLKDKVMQIRNNYEKKSSTATSAGSRPWTRRRGK